MRQQYYLLAGSVVILLLPFLVFSEFLNSYFVADDYFFTKQSIPMSSKVFTTSWGHELYPGVSGYRPMSLMSYELNRLISGDTPSSFRALNYLLHSLVSIVLFFFFSKLGFSFRASSLGVLLFLFHPIHHEPLFWISGRTVLISTLFILLALIFSSSKVIFSLIFLVFALLSYELAVVFPLLFIIYELFQGKSFREAVQKGVPFILVVCSYLIFRWGFLSEFSNEAGAFIGQERIFKNTFSFIMRLLILPTETTPSWSIPLTVSIVTAFCVLIGVYSSKKNIRSLLCFIAFICGSFLPYFLYEGYADRFGYLASIGWIGILILPLSFVDSKKIAGILSSLLFLLTLGWSIQLYSLGTDWREAGKIAQFIPNELHTMYPNPPTEDVIYLSDIPGVHNQAYLFPTYLELAIQQRYARDDIKVKRGVGNEPHRTFQWSSEKGKLVQLSSLETGTN